MKKLLCAAVVLIVFTLPASARIILFIGNSFTMGAGAAARIYQTNTVHDLNPPNDHGQILGGEATLFKEMNLEAGLDYAVSVEAVGAKNFDFHFNEKHDVLDKPWDEVVM